MFNVVEDRSPHIYNMDYPPVILGSYAITGIISRWAVKTLLDNCEAFTLPMGKETGSDVAE